MRGILPLTAVLLSAVTCGGGGSSTSFSSDGGSVAVDTGGESGTSTSSSSSSSTSSVPDESTTGSSSGGTTANSDPTFDMGMPDFGPRPPDGCQGKIDFIFVISADDTMTDLQQRLLASFPGFMAAIEDQLPEFDVHILSADADGLFGKLDDCSSCIEDCDPQGSPPLCGAVIEPCDKKIGSGVLFPVGEGASNRRCKPLGASRYITEAEPDLTDAFTCIAQVGIDGAIHAGEAMVAALEDPFECNAGFLRDDALLVVTLIQDTYDEYSAGTVESWIEALRTAKHGNDDAFAVLVLSTDIDVGYQQLCVPNEYDPEKNRLRLLAEGVKHGFIGSICAEAYDGFFLETVAAIEELCEGFVIPR